MRFLNVQFSIIIILPIYLHNTNNKMIYLSKPI